MEMAQRHDVDRLGQEIRRLERRQDRRALVPAHGACLVVDAFADARLDQDAAGRRLDQEAVERLEQAVLGIDLVGNQAVPKDPRHRPEQGAGVRPERAGLDERDPRAPAEVRQPVDRLVDRHA
jgi:hypothetical protein